MAVTKSGKDKHLRHARIYASGYDLSGDARSFGKLDNSLEEIDRSGWNEDHRHFLSSDQRMVGIQGLQVIMNDTTGRSYDRLKTESNTGIIDLLFGGGGAPAVGDPAYMLRTLQIAHQAGLESRLGVLTGDFVADSAQYVEGTYNPMGVVIQDATSLTATGNGSSVDNEAASTKGGWANLQVTATAAGNFAFKLQHSTDDAAWADITGGAFTLDGSAVGAESIEFTGTINRYIRFVRTRTAGTCTVICTVARN